MQSKELIRQLQELDPTGETQVSIGNCDIWHVTMEPAYYDGRLHVIDFDENHRPIRGRRVTSGSKIVLDPISIQDAIEYYEDENKFVVEYADDEERKRYEYIDRESKRRKDQISIDIDREAFVDWVFLKIQSIRKVPLGWVDRIRKAATYYYDEHHMSPENPILTMKANKSYNDCREEYYENTFEVDWDKYSKITIKAR